MSQPQEVRGQAQSMICQHGMPKELCPDCQPKPLKSATMEWASSEYMRNLFKLLATIGEDVEFQVKPDGVFARFMDPSRVSMLELKMGKAFCEEYVLKNLGPEEYLKFVLNVDWMLKKPLQKVYEDERLRLEIEETKDIRIILKGVFERRFTFHPSDDAFEQIPVPKIHYTYVAKLSMDHDPDNFDTPIADIFNNFDSVVELIGTPDKLTLKEEGENPCRIDLNKNSEAVLDLQCHQEAGKEEPRGFYSTTYLQEFFRNAKEVGNVVELSFARDMPLQIQLTLLRDLEIRFWFAPRITSDC